MIKLGLLGAGRIGMTHARAIQKIAQAQISAVFEPLDQAAAAAVALTGAKRATMEEITSSAEISGVIIATPTDLHAEQIETMARAGISGNIPSGIDGLRAMELADAAFKSMHTGQFVTV